MDQPTSPTPVTPERGEYLWLGEGHTPPPVQAQAPQEQA